MVADRHGQAAKYREEDVLGVLGVGLASEAAVGKSNEKSDSQNTSSQTVEAGHEAAGRVAAKNVDVCLLQDVHRARVDLW